MKVTGLSARSSDPASLTAILDPAILADVQYALKVKARREARLRGTGPIRTDTSLQFFFSNLPSPNKALSSPGENLAFPSVNRTDAGEDFVASLDVSVPHPMPRSLDKGRPSTGQGRRSRRSPGMTGGDLCRLTSAKRRIRRLPSHRSTILHWVFPTIPLYDGIFRRSRTTNVLSYDPYT